MIKQLFATILLANNSYSIDTDRTGSITQIPADTTIEQYAYNFTDYDGNELQSFVTKTTYPPWNGQPLAATININNYCSLTEGYYEYQYFYTTENFYIYKITPNITMNASNWNFRLNANPWAITITPGQTITMRYSMLITEDTFCEQFVNATSIKYANTFYQNILDITTNYTEIYDTQFYDIENTSDQNIYFPQINIQAQLTQLSQNHTYYICMYSHFTPQNISNNMRDTISSRYITVDKTDIEYLGTSVIIADTEIVDIPGLMFYILSMPFAFISQAFNLTLFEGTGYAINIGALFLGIIGVCIFLWIIKLILGRADMTGLLQDHHASKLEKQKFKHSQQMESTKHNNSMAREKQRHENKMAEKSKKK